MRIDVYNTSKASLPLLLMITSVREAMPPRMTNRFSGRNNQDVDLNMTENTGSCQEKKVRLNDTVWIELTTFYQPIYLVIGGLNEVRMVDRSSKFAE